ncbi:MAG: hypothetical protein KGJ60_06605 [Verrucomicrobiota bacterium]|nr:hypothetical protein [Verrucomicrobiota bacterium]
MITVTPAAFAEQDTTTDERKSAPKNRLSPGPPAAPFLISLDEKWHSFAFVSK